MWVMWASRSPWVGSTLNVSVAQVSDLDSKKNNNESIDISYEFNIIIPWLLLDLGFRDIMSYAYKITGD